MAVPTRDRVPNPLGMGFGMALNDTLFRLAVGPGRELTIETAPPEAPRVSTATNAEELAAEYGLTFSRTRFEGGEGLLHAHVQDAAPNRFWDSKNISISPPEPGEFPTFSLLHSTTWLNEDEPWEWIEDDITPRMAYDEVTGTLYVTNKADVYRVDNPLDPVPTFQYENPRAGEPGTPLSEKAAGGIATIGGYIYIGLGTNGIHRKEGPDWAEWTHWNDVTSNRLWAVKGRVMSSDGRNLYEVLTSGAAPSPLVTLPPGKEWTSVCDGGEYVLASATDGYVYSFESVSGALQLTSQTFFPDEHPTALGQTQGVVAVGTSYSDGGRMYVGGVADNGQVTDLRLVKEWGSGHPQHIHGTRSSLVTAVPEGTDTYMWLYDVRTGGLSRHLTLENTGGKAVLSILSIGDRLFAGVFEKGTYREDTTFSSEGYLIGPLGDFVSSREKSWVAASLNTQSLADGRVVELYYTIDPEALLDPDSVEWTRAIRRDEGSGDPGPTALVNVVSRSLAGMVKLTSTGATSPKVKSFSFAAYPSAGDEEQIVSIPVNVSDRIERRGMARRIAKGGGAFTYRNLLSFEGRPVVLRLYSPTLTIRGVVERVSAPIMGVSGRGSPTLLSMVRVRGRTEPVVTDPELHVFGSDRTFGTPPPMGLAE